MSGTLDEYFRQTKLVGFISPPYSDQNQADLEHGTQTRFSHGRERIGLGYGSSEGQIGMLESKSQEALEPEIDIEALCSCPEIYWFDCYKSDSRYKQFITTESFAHPAKASFGLIERIYKHLEQLELLKQGDKIIDFMAGTSRIPLVAALKGYSTISVELESHFVQMSEGNKAHAERFTGKKLDMQIIKGDARKLSELLEHGGVGVVSPPYIDMINKNGEGPQAVSKENERYGEDRWQVKYSDNFNNIGNLKDGPSLVGFTSPAYESMSKPNRPMDDVRAVNGRANIAGNYNAENPDNLGNQDPQSYTEAMLQVYSEAFKAGISPLITITKNPTRQGKLRRLNISTIEMLQKAGYKILDYHRAILFKIARNETLDGSKEAETYKGRLSFFKRLSLAKGNCAAEWEDIIIAVNPAGNFGKVGAVSPPYLAAGNQGGGL